MIRPTPTSFLFPSPILFFFNDTATTEIYTLSLHDALPISAIAVTLMLALSACDRGAGAAGMSGMPPAAVTYQAVAAEEVSVEQEYVAQANGSREVEIRARVNGIIEKRLYAEGSFVKAGTPLFRLDAATYAAAAAQAEAALDSADANLKQAERE